MVIEGQLLIVKIVLLAEKTAKTLELRIFLQKFVERLNKKMKPKPRFNNVDETTSEAGTVGASATAGEQVNQIETIFQNNSIYDAIYDFDYDEFDDNCVAIISDTDNIRRVKPVNLNLCIGKTETKALVDLGRVCNIINKSAANAVKSNCLEISGDARAKDFLK